MAPKENIQVNYGQHMHAVSSLQFDMESAPVRCLLTSLGVSEIEQVSVANE